MSVASTVGFRRQVHSFAEIYPGLAPSELLHGARDPHYAAHWERTDATSFMPRAAIREAA